MIGPGFGAWADACILRSEVSAGPVGVHLGPNVNTGVGVRRGNVDLHILGSGVKLGRGGVTLDTPVGGAKCLIL